MNKRDRESSQEQPSSSDDEDAFGPTMDMFQGVEETTEKLATKKKKRLKRTIIKALNLNPEYVNSYMHKTRITAVCNYKDLVITGSKDGIIKMWKVRDSAHLEKKEQPEVETGLEEPGVQTLDQIKEFVTGGSIIQLKINTKDETMLALSQDESVARLFDLRNQDLIDILELGFIPELASLAYFENYTKLVLVEKGTSKIHIMDHSTGEVLDENSELHSTEIKTLDYNSQYKCMVSTDSRGMIEYWEVGGTYSLPKSVEFEMKSKTDLYAIRKSKSEPQCSCLSHNGDQLAVYSTPDNTIRIFKFSSGKLIKSVKAKVAGNMTFDKSGNFLVFAPGTAKGLQVLNLITEESNYLGTALSFNQVALVEPNLGKITIEMTSSVSNEILKKSLNEKPKILLIASSLENERVYVFSNGTSDEANSDQRDIYNEVAAAGHSGPIFTSSGTAKHADESNYKDITVTIHTNLGDIQIQLYYKQAPLAVKNFVDLCKNKYYNDVIFHRIIANFMIQTGDPTGTGTGGKSIYGAEFKDEFATDLRHFKYMVSMANAGPSTNGSQFFVVTSDAQLTHLDDKHTVFGKVIDGTDVVDEISKIETDEDDRPVDFVPRIISTSIMNGS